MVLILFQKKKKLENVDKTQGKNKIIHNSVLKSLSVAKFSVHCMTVTRQ